MSSSTHNTAAMSLSSSRRAHKKRQTRLAFDPVNPGSSATMSPARIRYESSSAPSRRFNLSSPVPNSERNDIFPSGKNYAVVIESPPSRKKDSKIPFKPVSASSPLRSSATQVSSSKNSSTFIPSMFSTTI
jgi:hypothetical protein